MYWSICVNILISWNIYLEIIDSNFLYIPLYLPTTSIHIWELWEESAVSHPNRAQAVASCAESQCQGFISSCTARCWNCSLARRNVNRRRWFGEVMPQMASQSMGIMNHSWTKQFLRRHWCKPMGRWCPGAWTEVDNERAHHWLKIRTISGCTLYIYIIINIYNMFLVLPELYSPATNMPELTGTTSKAYRFLHGFPVGEGSLPMGPTHFWGWTSIANICWCEQQGHLYYLPMFFALTGATGPHTRGPSDFCTSATVQ